MSRSVTPRGKRESGYGGPKVTNQHQTATASTNDLSLSLQPPILVSPRRGFIVSLLFSVDFGNSTHHGRKRACAQLRPVPLLRESPNLQELRAADFEL